MENILVMAQEYIAAEIDPIEMKVFVVASIGLIICLCVEIHKIVGGKA